MLSRREYQCIEAGEAVWNIESMPEGQPVADPATRLLTVSLPTVWRCMHLLKPLLSISKPTEDGFVSCAAPMKVEPLGENGYALTIGRLALWL